LDLVPKFLTGRHHCSGHFLKHTSLKITDRKTKSIVYSKAFSDKKVILATLKDYKIEIEMIDGSK